MAQHTSGVMPIESYGVVGDMRSAALISAAGAVNWLCWPQFDSAPVFAGLLDEQSGGCCVLEGPWRPASRRYRDRTAILETTVTNGDQTVCITDFMAVEALDEPGDTGPDHVALGVLFRVVRRVSGTGVFSVRIDPRFEWGQRQEAPLVQARTTLGVNTAVWPGRPFSLGCAAPMRVQEGAVLVDVDLTTDQPLVLVLSSSDGFDFSDWPTAAGAQRALAATGAYWGGWMSSFGYQGPHAEAAARSALTLKLLTHAPTGGVVAAATTSLPEAPGFDRNWDYRFVWTRDATFSVSAFLCLGFRREAAEFLRFLHHRDGGGEGTPLRVVYALNDAVPPELKHAALAGWRGFGPVRSGNNARDQQQNEIFGEYLAALWLYISKHGLDGLCPELAGDLERFVASCAQAACACWRQPDQGIWELQGDPRQLLHSKGVCWLALDCAIQIGERMGFAQPENWTRERDTIRNDLETQGWRPQIGAYGMEYGADDLDISTIRLALAGVLDPSSAKFKSTVAATEAALTGGDFHYRYRFDDGLCGREGAFVAASFWMCGAFTLTGRRDDAEALLESMIAAANDLGLFAEQLDVASGAFLGNFPQALSHMALIHEVSRLYDPHS